MTNLIFLIHVQICLLWRHFARVKMKTSLKRLLFWFGPYFRHFRIDLMTEGKRGELASPLIGQFRANEKGRDEQNYFRRFWLAEESSPPTHRSILFWPISPDEFYQISARDPFPFPRKDFFPETLFRSRPQKREKIQKKLLYFFSFVPVGPWAVNGR